MRTCSQCGRQFTSSERVCPDDGTVLSDTVSVEEQPIGKTLDGKYRIDGFLKRGGMGAVYRGTHVLLHKPVAIKLIRPELVTSDDMVRRFFVEARAASKLSHPNIVTVHDLGQTSDGTLYIVMELVDGQSLKELIKTEGPLEPSRALKLARGIASALSLAHRTDIVHRDLKPQNIMVTHDSEGREIPKLLDFGIAKILGAEAEGQAQHTATGMVLGTPHYMSTEQAKGLPADPRSDLYALGVILYEMLVGKVPFDDTSVPSILVKHLSEPPPRPRALKGDIPPEVEALVLRCLEKDPDQRFQTADELISALEGLAATTATTPLVGPTEAMTAVSEAQEPQVTMAGGAAAAPSLPRIPVPAPHAAASESGTMRAREVAGRDRERSPSSRLVLVALLVLVLLAGAAVALFTVARWRQRPEASPPVAAASVAPLEAPAEEAAPPPTENESAPPDPSPSEPPPGETDGPAVAAPAPPPKTAPKTAAPAPPKTMARTEPVRPPAAPPVERPAQTPTPAPPPAADPVPATGTVSVACEGLPDACAGLKAALARTLEREGLRMAPPARAEIHLALQAEEVEARSEQQFGTTFVVRTYSITGDADVPRFGDYLTVEPKSFSFDARFGREKLRGQVVLIASDIAKELSTYWTEKTASR